LATTGRSCFPIRRTLHRYARPNSVLWPDSSPSFPRGIPRSSA
jgi:hypothetical protein